MRGSYAEIISHMAGKVFTIRTEDEGELEEIKGRYKVLNLQREGTCSEVKVVSPYPLSGFNISATAPRFEDVYMFYYDLEKEYEGLKQ